MYPGMTVPALAIFICFTSSRPRRWVGLEFWKQTDK
jgi:hypothetical protein